MKPWSPLASREIPIGRHDSGQIRRPAPARTPTKAGGPSLSAVSRRQKSERICRAVSVTTPSSMRSWRRAGEYHASSGTQRIGSSSGCYSARKFDPSESSDIKGLACRSASNPRAAQHPYRIIGHTYLQLVLQHRRKSADGFTRSSSSTHATRHHMGGSARSGCCLKRRRVRWIWFAGCEDRGRSEGRQYPCLDGRSPSTSVRF